MGVSLMVSQVMQLNALDDNIVLYNTIPSSPYLIGVV